MKTTKYDTLIKFNWKLILTSTGYKYSKALQVIEALAFLKIPTKKELIIIQKMINSDIDCWLVDPIAFFTSYSTDMEKSVYLQIASHRSWLDYQRTGTTFVPLYMVEHIFDKDTLKGNPLLKVTDTVIDLKY